MTTPCVLVTGGSGGIGRAIVKVFAQAGFRVVLHYYQGQEKALDIQQRLAAEGCQVFLQQADIRRKQEVTQMIAAIGEQWGDVGILINNSGIAQQKLFTDITPEEWHDMFAVHVDGAFYCCQAVLPAMIRRRSGCIINISSMWGQIGGSCEVHYSAAKGALEAMTKALAKETGPSGIRVNAVAPGVIQTAMNQQLDDEALAALREETPLGMLGSPLDVANLVYYLASDKAAFITGQIIGCNGGLVI